MWTAPGGSIWAKNELPRPLGSKVMANCLFRRPQMAFFTPILGFRKSAAIFYWLKIEPWNFKGWYIRSKDFFYFLFNDSKFCHQEAWRRRRRKTVFSRFADVPLIWLNFFWFFCNPWTKIHLLPQFQRWTAIFAHSIGQNVNKHVARPLSSSLACPIVISQPSYEANKSSGH